MAGHRLQRQGQRQGLGGEGAGVVGRDRAALAEAPLRMDAGRRGARLGGSEGQGPLAGARLQGTTEALGSGAKFFMDGPEPQEELRDYERLPETGETLLYVAMSRL